MNLLKHLFRRKEKRRYTVSDFEKASVRGEYKHCIYEVGYNPDRSIRVVVGIVIFDARRIFVTWDAQGRAFVVRERDKKFDLLFK